MAVLVVFFADIRISSAIPLTASRAYMNRQIAAQTSGQQFELFFTPTFSLSLDSGTLLIVFPDADDGLWCRSAGTLTPTGIANPSGATESATSISTFGSTSCAIGSGTGSADSNRDRLSIVVAQAITSGTKYGVRVVGNSGVLGTAAAANNIKAEMRWSDNDNANFNTSTVALSLVADDQIAVSALVDVTLSVTLSSNTAALGTLSTSQVNQAGVTSTVSTSAAGGYISVVNYGATLTSGANTIPNTSGGTIVAGTSEFGASSSQSGNTIGQWSPTSCASTSSTSNATALSGTFQSFANNTSAVTNEVATLCFLASISGSQAPGSYTSTATLVTTARF